MQSILVHVEQDTYKMMVAVLIVTHKFCSEFIIKPSKVTLKNQI